MSMTCYAGRIEVQISGTGTVSFEYEFDNEICPRISIPDDWRARCADRAQIPDFIDQLLWEDGLRELIQEFDECLPDEELMSEPRYDAFLSQIENASGTIEQITVSVINEEDDSVESQEVLAF